MDESRDWLARSRRAVWHPCTQMKRHERLPLVPIARGDGAWLVDFDGRRYLDAVSSWWVNLFGHGHPAIKAAIKDQLDTLEHVMLAGFTHAPVVELSERLAELSGLGHAFYGSDGASATEIALKMSFHYWKNLGQPSKCRFVSLENSYHGETVGALAVTDVPLFSATYAELTRAGLRVPTPDARLALPGETDFDVAVRAATALENVLTKRHGEVAALIVEPLVQGAAGMAMYHPEYLRRARAACDRYGVHLIADEIAVGFGRTGTLFACEQAGIRPDFLCLSKGITGGFLPLSCVLTTDSVYDAFYDEDVTRGFLHSHSYTGNPLACRAALAVLELFERDDVLAVNRAKAERFGRLMAPLAAHDATRHFRHTGMIWAFDVDSPRADFAPAFFAAMLDKGCLTRPIGKSVYFMPPYVVGDDEIARLVEATLATLATLAPGAADDSPETALP
ncbi:adenosylmethionine-8-amino-7-oxononanoate aminotransferase [Crenobacter luteus]|uniref:adenosylmethionine--8-amino-7-oxononanoate transaminase n=1 Tax=Crenobacter luteus TaxID=1452487 RepID=UPI0010532847|nr:adenosylmethionine--8-amino-7-oxononanoate transaminase [Crenobacter luteus]TCP15278.1 adenosylmethionine-8-amino-7-oxononanoate aminotransferase [Crenobacter luteus]